MSDILPQDVIMTYRRYAPLYDLLFGAILGPGRKKMAKAASALQPVSILEVGVGTGLALPDYPLNTRIVGIDISEEMLQRAKIQADKLHQHDISLHVMDAEQLEFDDNSFDCVTIPYVLSVTPDPTQLITEARRVCKPDGHILIVNHFSGSKFWWILERTVKSLADRIGFRSKFDFDQHILPHDWTVKHVVPVNVFHLSRMVVIKNA